MIRIEDLHKSFRDGDHSHAVLDGLHMEIPAGRFVALIGRSGSGKSTLLNCIAGIEKPDAGRIHIGDVEITGLNDRDRTRLRRDRVGIVFQFFNLLPMLSVIDNVALPGLLRGDRRSEVLDRARELLAELDLADRADEMPDRLSGGEQQRVATARALINSPAILLADEPTGNLDAETARKTLELLRQVNERHGVTIVMVTHSQEAAAVAEIVATLEGGRVELPEMAAPTEATQDEAPEEGNDDGDGVETVVAAVITEEVVADEPAPEESDPDAAPKLRPSAKAAALLRKKPDAESSLDEDPDDDGPDVIA